MRGATRGRRGRGGWASEEARGTESAKDLAFFRQVRDGGGEMGGQIGADRMW